MSLRPFLLVGGPGFVRLRRDYAAAGPPSFRLWRGRQGREKLKRHLFTAYSRSFCFYESFLVDHFKMSIRYIKQAVNRIKITFNIFIYTFYTFLTFIK